MSGRSSDFDMGTPFNNWLGLAGLSLLVFASQSIAWDDADDYGGGGFKTKTTQNNYGFKSHQSEDTPFATQQRNSLKVESIQESQERRNRWNEEFNTRSKQIAEDHDRDWKKPRDRAEAENNAWEAQQWRDVETVAGAFIASGPYYKSGQRMVQTDKGLIYATGNGGVVAPDGYYYRSGNVWVGPNGKLAGQSGTGNNEYIWSSDGKGAIGGGRGFFTERGYSWPAYPEQVTRSVIEKHSWSSR